MTQAATVTVAKPEVMPERALCVPLVDVFESDDGLELFVELPGVTLEGLEVRLEDDVMTIDGRRSVECPAEARWIRRETEWVNFRRAFVIEGEFDRDRIEATFRNGVLRLVLPKAARSQTRRIDIQTI